MSSSKITLAERRPVTEPPAGFDLENGPVGRLRSIALAQRLRRRQRLTLQGHDAVYIVRSGLVAVEGAPLPDARAILELLYPGDIVVPSLQAPIPDLALTTATAAEFWRLSVSAFTQELHRDAALSDHVFHRLNAQRARMQLHVAILAGLASEQRVAALLIEAACRLGNRDGKAISFELPLSRTEVAEYLALNADTLSRIMSRLTQSNVIERSGRAQMTIRDWDGLVAHCPLALAVMALHKRT
ncbi:MAG: Crp/Fnr family transcriptional regulator [Hyphomicrobium sp.]